MLAIIVMFNETRSCLASYQQPSCPCSSSPAQGTYTPKPGPAPVLQPPAGCSQACPPDAGRGQHCTTAASGRRSRSHLGSWEGGPLCLCTACRGAQILRSLPARALLLAWCPASPSARLFALATYLLLPLLLCNVEALQRALDPVDHLPSVVWE